MAEKTDIFNMAVSLIGSRAQISDPETDVSEGAINCRTFYDTAVGAALRMAPWGFAKKTLVLSQLKTSVGQNIVPWSALLPPPPWKYSYVYPSDCVALRYIVSQGLSSSGLPLVPIFGPAATFYAAPDDSRQWWKFEMGTDTDASGASVTALFTDAPGAIATYTFRNDVVPRWPPDFVKAVAAQLAAAILLNVTGEAARARPILAMAEDASEAARVANANEALQNQYHTPDAIRARGYNGYDY